MKDTVAASLRLPADDVKSIDAIASEIGMTRSSVMAWLLMWGLRHEQEAFSSHRRMATTVPKRSKTADPPKGRAKSGVIGMASRFPLEHKRARMRREAEQMIRTGEVLLAALDTTEEAQ